MTDSRAVGLGIGVGSTINTVENLIVSELKGPAIFQLFNPKRRSAGLVYPEMYFLAAGELLVLMIGVSAVITYIVQPLSMQCIVDGVTICNNSTLELNAIKLRVGHNNPCVYFDTPPAKYFAAIVYVFAAYCGVQYTLLDMERSFLVKERLSCCKFYFSIISDVLYMFAWAGFVMTYVIPPWQNIWAHSTGFICLGTAQFLIFFSNTLEGENFPILVYVFCGIYGVFTIAEFGFAAGANFYYYDITDGKEPPLIPNLLGTIIDYGWFATLAITSAVMPRSEGLLRETKIVPVGAKIGNAEEEEGGFMGICGGDEEEEDED
mmetsp:Transcript_81637/g.141910  ORF Transcript_81637/g.141910 Transcript_81637/m.141910 type:complete len:320 (+) Transcript_81637:92-1051(+)